MASESPLFQKKHFARPAVFQPENLLRETLFDTGLILDRLQVDEQLGDVVELGCGYGTFTLPVARRISGTPRGPSMDIRPRPEQIVEWAKPTGLLASPGPLLDLPPWHYGIRLQRCTLPSR